MSNPFEGYAKALTTVVSHTMGEDAIWIPSDRSAPAGITARVLFNNPTKKNKLQDVEYNPFDWQMEYHKDSFDGLKALVDAGNSEVITINSTGYFVKDVITKWDGDTSLAKLELI